MKNFKSWDNYRMIQNCEHLFLCSQCLAFKGVARRLASCSGSWNLLLEIVHPLRDSSPMTADINLYFNNHHFLYHFKLKIFTVITISSHHAGCECTRYGNVSAPISWLLGCVSVISIVLVLVASLQEALRSVCFGKIHSVKPENWFHSVLQV